MRLNTIQIPNKVAYILRTGLYARGPPIRLQDTRKPTSDLLLKLLRSRTLIPGVTPIIRRSTAHQPAHNPTPKPEREQLPYLPREILRPHNRRAPHRIRRQQRPPPATLPHRQRHKIINHAPTEDPIAHGAGGAEAHAREHFDQRAGRGAFEEGGRGVVQEVEDADAGEGFGNDMCEDGRGGGGVHGAEWGGDVVELDEGVDGHKDVRNVEASAVPEDHPGWFGRSQQN